MEPCGYTVKITNLAPNVTEKDLRDLLNFCGAIQHLEILRSEELSCTAYMTFKNRHAMETAILLSGTILLDHPINITKCDDYEGHHGQSKHSSMKIVDDESPTQRSIAKTVTGKGYMLGKEALSKAIAFDESHHLSATAASKFSEFGQKTGLSGKLYAGIEVARSTDDKFGITSRTKSVASAAGRTAVSAANAVVSSSYFSKVALWVSGALRKGSQVAADLGSRGAAAGK